MQPCDKENFLLNTFTGTWSEIAFSSLLKNQLIFEETSSHISPTNELYFRKRWWFFYDLVQIYAKIGVMADPNLNM